MDDFCHVQRRKIHKNSFCLRFQAYFKYNQVLKVVD